MPSYTVNEIIDILDSHPATKDSYSKEGLKKYAINNLARIINAKRTNIIEAVDFDIFNDNNWEDIAIPLYKKGKGGAPAVLKAIVYGEIDIDFNINDNWCPVFDNVEYDDFFYFVDTIELIQECFTNPALTAGLKRLPKFRFYTHADNNAYQITKPLVQENVVMVYQKLCDFILMCDVSVVEGVANIIYHQLDLDRIPTVIAHIDPKCHTVNTMWTALQHMLSSPKHGFSDLVFAIPVDASIVDKNLELSSYTKDSEEDEDGIGGDIENEVEKTLNHLSDNSTHQINHYISLNVGCDSFSNLNTVNTEDSPFDTRGDTMYIMISASRQKPEDGLWAESHPTVAVKSAQGLARVITQLRNSPNEYLRSTGHALSIK